MTTRRGWFVWPILAVAMIGAALFAGAGAESAEPGSATERLRQFFKAANQVLEDPATAYKPLEKMAAIRRLVSEIGDWDTASARVLGPEWRLRGPAERDEFSRLFGDLLQRTFVAVMASRARVEGGTSVTWQGERVEGDEAVVTTIVEGRGGHTFPVIYRMGQSGGQWRVRDVVFEGVSLVENYRAQVVTILRRSSYPQLLGEMRSLVPDAVATPSLVAAPSVIPMPGAAPAPGTTAASAVLALRDPALIRRPFGSAPAPASPFASPASATTVARDGQTGASPSTPAQGATQPAAPGGIQLAAADASAPAAEDGTPSATVETAHPVIQRAPAGASPGNGRPPAAPVAAQPADAAVTGGTAEPVSPGAPLAGDVSQSEASQSETPRMRFIGVLPPPPGGALARPAPRPTADPASVRPLIQPAAPAPEPPAVSQPAAPAVPAAAPPASAQPATPAAAAPVPSAASQPAAPAAPAVASPAASQPSPPATRPVFAPVPILPPALAASAPASSAASQPAVAEPAPASAEAPAAQPTARPASPSGSRPAPASPAPAVVGAVTVRPPAPPAAAERGNAAVDATDPGIFGGLPPRPAPVPPPAEPALASNGASTAPPDSRATPESESTTTVAALPPSLAITPPPSTMPAPSTSPAPVETHAAEGQRPHHVYWVQVGWYRDPQAAARVAERLSKFAPTIVTGPLTRTPGPNAELPARVVMGPFTDRSDAAAAVKHLGVNGIMGFITEQRD